MSELIPITITVGDRSYRIKVEPEHEESVRKTARFIHDKVQEFKQQFAGKDMQDYVAMVLIWYATEISATNNNASPAVADTAFTEEALKKLELQIDQLLQAP